MRRLAKIGSMLFAILFSFSGTLAAEPLVEAARIPTVGCWSRDDVADLIQAGRIGGDISNALAQVSALIEQKIKGRRCFKIGRGGLAYTAPEWQKPNDAQSGIILMRTKSRLAFYTVGWNWQYFGPVVQ